MTVIVLAFTTFVAIVFPSIASIIDIIGGYCGTLLAFVIPATVYICSCKPPFAKRVFYIILSAVIGLSGFYSASYSVYHAITK